MVRSWWVTDGAINLLVGCNKQIWLARCFIRVKQTECTFLSNREHCSCDDNDDDDDDYDDGFCFILFFRVYSPPHAGFCFRGCGHPHTHHANRRLSAAQVGQQTLSLFHACAPIVPKTHSTSIALTIAVTAGRDVCKISSRLLLCSGASFVIPHTHIHTDNCEQIIFIMSSLPLQSNDDSVATSSCSQN